MSRRNAPGTKRAFKLEQRQVYSTRVNHLYLEVPRSAQVVFLVNWNTRRSRHVVRKYLHDHYPRQPLYRYIYLAQRQRLLVQANMHAVILQRNYGSSFRKVCNSQSYHQDINGNKQFQRTTKWNTKPVQQVSMDEGFQIQSGLCRI